MSTSEVLAVADDGEGGPIVTKDAQILPDVVDETNGTTVDVDIDVNYDDAADGDDGSASAAQSEEKPPPATSNGLLVRVVSAEAKVEEEEGEEEAESSESPSCDKEAAESSAMDGSEDLIKSTSGGGSDEAEAKGTKSAVVAEEEKVQNGSCDSVEDSLSHIANRLHQNDKLLEAARLLRTLQEDTLSHEQRAILSKAQSVDTLVESLQSAPDEKHGWTTLGENHSHGRDTKIYYKMDHPATASNPTLNVRLQTPIDATLLVPLISVLNESELYQSWIPSWSVPRFGVRRVTKLSQMGRCSQVIQVTMDAPWPLAPREVVLRALAVDDIDAHHHIVVDLHSLQAGDEDGLVPAAEGKVKRMDFAGGFLIQKCPPEEGGKDNDKLLVSFCMQIEDTMSAVPQWLLNFMVKTVIAMSWNMLLNVAEEVRDGTRPMHADAIEEKRDCLYDWVDVRVGEMLGSTVAAGKGD